MFRLSVLLAILPTVAAPAASVPSDDKANPATGSAREMTNAERLASWKGEKVLILGSKPSRCALPKDGAPYMLWRPGAPENDRLSVNLFAGQTGTIIQAEAVSDSSNQIVTQLEDGQKVIARDETPLGFQAELEAARKMIGRSLWSRGPQTIASPGTLCADSITDKGRISLNNLERVTITGAEFGTHLQKIHFVAKTDDGREGVLDGWEGNDFVDTRFHLVKASWGVRLGPYSDRFHLEDQRKLHPTWSAAVWKLIGAGDVAIGMTEEMAYLACGRYLRPAGFILSGTG